MRIKFASNKAVIRGEFSSNVIQIPIECQGLAGKRLTRLQFDGAHIGTVD
jgi:hypothetical protein